MWYGISALRPFEQYALFGVLFIAVLGLLYALFLRKQVINEDCGTPAMQKVWGAIREGANAYLKRQLKTILPLIGLLTVCLFLLSVVPDISCLHTGNCHLLAENSLVGVEALALSPYSYDVSLKDILAELVAVQVEDDSVSVAIVGLGDVYSVEVVGGLDHLPGEGHTAAGESFLVPGDLLIGYSGTGSLVVLL